jgi:hypothetical protein
VRHIRKSADLNGLGAGFFAVFVFTFVSEIFESNIDRRISCIGDLLRIITQICEIVSIWEKLKSCYREYSVGTGNEHLMANFKNASSDGKY